MSSARGAEPNCALPRGLDECPTLNFSEVDGGELQLGVQKPNCALPRGRRWCPTPSLSEVMGVSYS